MVNFHIAHGFMHIQEGRMLPYSHLTIIQMVKYNLLKALKDMILLFLILHF